MGLIKNDGYTSERLGITIPQAYAKIVYVSIDNSGNANTVFSIHQTREETVSKESIDTVYTTTKIDKDLPVYEQIYIAAKEETFADWEDDIVTEDNTVEETIQNDKTV